MDRGLKILLNTYWSSEGWKRPVISDEDFQVAKEQGYMFDYPTLITHEETLNQINQVTDLIAPEDVANAFLYSLSTRKLEYRSALGSYWYALSIPYHKWSYKKYYHCSCCMWMPRENGWEEENPSVLKNQLNHMNFERYKWGGVRHTHALYALFDLQQFLKLPAVEHTMEDEKLLHDILACVYELEPKNKAGVLQKLITKKKILKSNKQEVDTLLDILGICGVLSSDEHPCYAVRFSEEVRRDPPELTNDRSYPVNHWKASDGICMERYKVVFGREYSDRRLS